MAEIVAPVKKSKNDLQNVSKGTHFRVVTWKVKKERGV
jgi:hypothetical protein